MATGGKISYSQYTMYANCPRMWKLNYIDKLAEYSQSIHTLFGSAFHETLQAYLTIMYKESAVAADKEDWYKILKDFMAKEYRKALAMGQDKDFTNAFEMGEFYQHGVDILDFVLKKRGVYFAKKDHELIGVEVPLDIRMEVNPNVKFKGYIDLIIKDKRDNTYKIIDIKTSTMGWNKYQKADKTKTAQLVLYKSYYAKQFNVPIENIRVEYFIVKRKLWENTDFPQKRVQLFTPASGKPTLNKINRSVDEFVRTSFNEDGSYNTNRVYPAVGGKNKKNCKYCEFRDRHDLCPVRERICE